jgi:hypothetical protein
MNFKSYGNIKYVYIVQNVAVLWETFPQENWFYIGFKVICI